MPSWAGNLSNPGLLVALCLIIFLVVGVNATLFSLFRRGPNKSEGESWSRAFSGARERQHQQAAQLDELHRAVAELKSGQTDNDLTHE